MILFRVGVPSGLVRGGAVGETLEFENIGHGERTTVGEVQGLRVEFHIGMKCSCLIPVGKLSKPGVHCWEHITAECDASGCLLSGTVNEA